MKTKHQVLWASSSLLLLIMVQLAAAQVEKGSAKPKDGALKPSNLPAKQLPGDTKLVKMPHQYAITKTDSTNSFELRVYVLNKGGTAQPGKLSAKVAYMKDDTKAPTVASYVILNIATQDYWDASADIPSLKTDEGAWVTLKFTKPFTLGLILQPPGWGKSKPKRLGAEIVTGNGKTQGNGKMSAVSAVYLDEAFFKS